MTSMEKAQADGMHTIQCATAEDRANAGEQLLIYPGPCWCGALMPEKRAPITRGRQRRIRAPR
jgi:hypothetical protein